MAFDADVVKISNFSPVPFPQNKEMGATFDFELVSDSASDGLYATGGLDVNFEDYEGWPQGYKVAELHFQQGTVTNYSIIQNEDKLLITTHDTANNGARVEIPNSTQLTLSSYGLSGRGYVRGRVKGLPGA